MKIKINNNTITEKIILKFFFILSILTSLSLFLFKIFTDANISWFLILFNLISCLYFDSLIKSYK